MVEATTWFRSDNLLPVEKLIFESPLVNIGTFRCAPESPSFCDFQPIANHVFVFPRTTVGIEMAGRPAFVSGPNIAVFYNRGQEYRRFAVANEADDCDWIAVAPEILFDIVGQFDSQVIKRRDRPFAADFLPSPARTYAIERSLAEELTMRTAEPLHVEETVVAMLADILANAVSFERRPLGSSTQRRIDKAKELLSEELGRALSLGEVADAVGISVYHLCKIFRRGTGYSMHQFRQNLRLRHSLGRVLDGEDLLATAIDLGFYSHSHFTSVFRGAFGVTPSEFRRGSAALRAAARVHRKVG